MSITAWFLLLGALLLLMGLRSSLLRRFNLTPTLVYLAVGVTLGPSVLGAFHFNPLKQSHLLEILAEIAVLVSLFIAGMKMPVPLSWQKWSAPLRLAFIGMTVSVALTAAIGYYLLALPLGEAVLLGAILAPTDPVLATDVQVRHMGDTDPLRFTLTSEAGMNDGSAFPFVVLGLALIHSPASAEVLGMWLLKDVLWSTVSALIVGVLMVRLLAHIVHRRSLLESEGPMLDDFLGLGLIAFVYRLCLLLESWGFLAVFVAVISLRQAELKLPGRGDASGHPALPHKTSLDSDITDPLPGPQLSEVSLLFKEPLERLSELVLVLLLGGMLFLDSWSVRAVTLALFLFLIVRQASVFLGLLGSGTPLRLKILVGWFGVRGIGSIYYLMFAIVAGLPEDLAVEMIHITLVVIVLSIIVHGLTVRPMMSKWWP